MKNYWTAALAISVLFHAVILCESSQVFGKAFKDKKSLTKKKDIKELIMAPQEIKKIIKQKANYSEDIEPLPYTENILSKLIKNANFSSLEKPQIFEKNIKEIVFSEISKVDKSLKKNPAYMNYYRLIREEIRKNAYRNYRSNKKGKVVINFKILKDGTLEKVDLSADSVSNKTLRKIALRSIKESAPFPAFPKGLSKYSHLQFNISIYFKNN